MLCSVTLSLQISDQMDSLQTITINGRGWSTLISEFQARVITLREVSKSQIELYCALLLSTQELFHLFYVLNELYQAKFYILTYRQAL